MASRLVIAQATARETGVAANGVAQEAVALLFDRHYTPLLRYVRRCTGDPELAADLVQETFLEAHRCFHRLNGKSGEENSAAWLYGIARNQLRVYQRRQRMHRFVSLTRFTDLLAATAPGLQRSTDTNRCHDRDLIDGVLTELSPPLRDALLLHSEAGCTAMEVAEILGISPGAAGRRISRANEQFRMHYEALNKGPDDVHL